MEIPEVIDELTIELYTLSDAEIYIFITAGRAAAGAYREVQQRIDEDSVPVI